MLTHASDISLVLDALERGDSEAGAQLFPLIYEELRRRAGQLMAAERCGHTLDKTALVHEAYLRLVRPGATYQSRLHFFNTAARAMRRILIDYAESRGAAKRGGGMQRQDLAEVDVSQAGPAIDVIALEEALGELNVLSPRQAEVVNLRFYAGLSDTEIAELLGISEKTVRRDWAAARLWLYDRMQS